MALIRTLLPSRAQRWGFFVLFWLVMATLSSLHWEVFYFGQNPYSWWELFRVKVALWYIWGFLTPLILWLGWKFRIERGVALRRIAVLIPISVAFTAGYMFLYAGMVWLNSKAVAVLSGETFSAFFDWIVGVHSSWYLLAFWASIGIENAAIYYRNYRERELLASQLETRLAVAQLDSLRNQLQPHFLFNTLHSILVLVRQKDHETATRMLTALSDLLRHALEHVQRHEVPLREELGFLQRYIDIEKVRFSDRLTVRWNVADDTLNASVPSFVLQPLAENAIRHGLEKRPGPGRIDVTTRRENGVLHLHIEDNGVGLQDDSPRAMWQGHGLGDMRARLDVMYPGSYSLDIASQNGSGTHVRLTLPYRDAHTTAATTETTDE